MAELTQSEIESKIAAIDASIATITDALTGGASAAKFTDYEIGQLKVSGSQQLEQLMKTREMYQGLLEKCPKEVADVKAYDVDVKGEDKSDLLGDE